MPFDFHRLEIPELILVEARSFSDDRGFFAETFKASDFGRAGIEGPFVQDNRSHSCHGVLRGLHYQKNPQAQGKLVMVLAGEIFDVAVDIRRGSPTYCRWIGLTLTAEPVRMLYVPPGFAHGFCVMSEWADLVYKTTTEYSARLERGITWDDPDIGIQWPLASPILSPRDARLPLLRESDNDFEFRS